MKRKKILEEFKSHFKLFENFNEEKKKFSRSLNPLLNSSRILMKRKKILEEFKSLFNPFENFNEEKKNFNEQRKKNHEEFKSPFKLFL